MVYPSLRPRKNSVWTGRRRGASPASTLATTASPNRWPNSSATGPPRSRSRTGNGAARLNLRSIQRHQFEDFCARLRWRGAQSIGGLVDGLLLRHYFRRIAYPRIATRVRLLLLVSWYPRCRLWYGAAHLVLRSLIGKREIILIHVLLITCRTDAPVRQSPGHQRVYSSDRP
jgi:hypothetical protein